LAAAPDTIFAHSSGGPPAAIAVIRISGPAAHRAANALAGELPVARRAALRRLRNDAGDLLDEALLLRFDAPASATGEDMVELHCHGGRAVVAAVLAELAKIAGLRRADPGEFTRRALGNGRIDLTEAEGLADLLEAETEQQRKLALASATGGLRTQVENWREQVIGLSAQAEAAIDYVGDEDETAIDLAHLHSSVEALGKEWERWLEQPTTELLRQGIRVVIAGPPNAGKSTLLNALVGEQRAIVTEVAGTTRDVIEVPLALDGTPFVLVDTAGLRDTPDRVEQIGVALAAEQIAAADVLLWLGEPQDAPAHPCHLLLHGQADRRAAAPPGSLGVSAVTGRGLEELKEMLLTCATSMLPADRIALNLRQSDALEAAAEALWGVPNDLVLLAEALRVARIALDRLTGHSGVEDMLDQLFGRFCLGK
jgi:tRNA modification GTPase